MRWKFVVMSEMSQLLGGLHTFMYGWIVISFWWSLHLSSSATIWSKWRFFQNWFSNDIPILLSIHQVTRNTNPNVYSLLPLPPSGIAGLTQSFSCLILHIFDLPKPQSLPNLNYTVATMCRYFKIFIEYKYVKYLCVVFHRNNTWGLTWP